MVNRLDFRFYHPFRIRYSEIDAQGVVFNANYLTFFDTALSEYFRKMNFSFMEGAKATGNDFHTVRAVVEYKAPIVYDQEIDVAVRTTRIGRSSIAFELAVFERGTDDLFTTGEIVWVYTNQETHKSSPLPDELRAKIKAIDPLAESA